MKFDKADTTFSKYIRYRDNWTCQRCHKRHPENSQGLHCSHYFGRAKEGTRYDPDNCDALCFGCHQEWGSNDKESYRNFKIKQLGINVFKLLEIKAFTYHKKDRKMSYIIAKLLLKNELSKYDKRI